MPIPRTAYQITEKLHDTYFNGTGILTPEELAASNVSSHVGSTSSQVSQRIEAEGLIDGRPARQVLAKDRFGNFHFSTLFIEPRGELVQSRVSPGSLPETLDPISASLFMQTLITLVLERA